MVWRSWNGSPSAMTTATSRTARKCSASPPGCAGKSKAISATSTAARSPRFREIAGLSSYTRPPRSDYKSAIPAGLSSQVAIAKTSGYCQVPCWVAFLYPTYTMKNLATVGWVELPKTPDTPPQPNGRNPTGQWAIAPTSWSCHVPCWVSCLYPTYSYSDHPRPWIQDAARADKYILLAYHIW